MATKLIMLAIILAVSTMAIAAIVPSASTADNASATCNQEATHTDLLEAEAIESINESGEATSTSRNTEAVVEDTTAFVRLRADNPNGYCVAYAIRISPEIVAPADLGTIESLDEDVSADWRAIQDLNSGEVFTEVTFTLEPGENATFAPSRVRVKSLDWTGDAKRSGSSIMSSVRGLIGSVELEEREYTIEPDRETDRITVPLEDGNGSEVEDWLASYEVDGRTAPVGTDSSDPVYYSESESSVTFHFNDEEARVELTVEPNSIDEFSHSARSYLSGISRVSDWLPFSISIARGSGLQGSIA